MLIGLCGLPGAGKSTAAEHLAQVYGFARINVGDPMKDMLRALYLCCGLSHMEIERRVLGDLKEAPDRYLNGRSPRYALQTLGKEWRDLIAPSFWADRWGDRIDVALRECGKAVSDGMRYLDELPVLVKRGGLLVRIVRPGIEDTTGHVAEKQVLPADVEIINDGSMDDLRKKIDGLIR